MGDRPFGGSELKGWPKVHLTYPPQRNKAGYEGQTIDHWIPLIRPAIKPLTGAMNHLQVQVVDQTTHLPDEIHDDLIYFPEK